MSRSHGLDKDFHVTTHHEFVLHQDFSSLSTTCAAAFTIDPRAHYAAQIFEGKSYYRCLSWHLQRNGVAICGAGLGTFLVLVSRKESLNRDTTRDVVVSEVPNAGVLTFLRDVKLAEEAVTATIARFERLDIWQCGYGSHRG
jgi:hypothetical protein